MAVGRLRIDNLPGSLGGVNFDMAYTERCMSMSAGATTKVRSTREAAMQLGTTSQSLALERMTTEAGSLKSPVPGMTTKGM